MQILAFLIAVAVPLLSLFAIYRLDLYKTGQFKIIWLSFSAGNLGLVGAVLINRAALDLGVARETVIVFMAPVVEEILKGLLLLALVRRPNFTYFVEGAIYGFAAGIGFAVAENFMYIAAAGSSGLGVAIGRVISTNLIHASATAVLGIALGLTRFRPAGRQIGIGLAGLLTAMLLHIVYNNLLSNVHGSVLLMLINAAACGLGGAGIIVFAIRRGLKEEKAWIEETLGVVDRVTRQEVAVVQHIENVQDILKPLAERFGSQKAAQIERFLFIQARLGILRKSLDKMTDERMKHSVEAQISQLRIEMDSARRQVGIHAMLYLRMTLPEDNSPVWVHLEEAIQKKMAARPIAGGMNVWASLMARQAQKAASAKEPNSET
jgi:RsiW-degrading membrane proteinase PrsW (M82 family)